MIWVKNLNLVATICKEETFVFETKGKGLLLKTTSISWKVLYIKLKVGKSSCSVNPQIIEW